MATSYLNQAGLSRGLRNNNPGNLIITTIPWQGKVPKAQNKDGHFEQFIELRYGIRAMMRDLITDYEKGKRTVKSLISEFAPSFENNTAAYMATVAARIGVSVDTVITDLTKEMLIALCRAIVLVENGSQYYSYVKASDYEDAFAILGKALPQKKKKA